MNPVVYVHDVEALGGFILQERELEPENTVAFMDPINQFVQVPRMAPETRNFQSSGHLFVEFKGAPAFTSCSTMHGVSEARLVQAM